MKKLILLTAILITMISCKNNNKSWPCGWEVSPAASVDKAQLDAHFAAHPERWTRTFEFLKKADLKSLELGEHEILGSEAYAIVSEYMPKEPEMCKFEAHRKYIDLQYIIEGAEMMGTVAPDSLQVTIPYTADIEFYGTDEEGATYEIANQDNFFIFFPNQPHRPSMNFDGASKVKKVVVKIEY